MFFVAVGVYSIYNEWSGWLEGQARQGEALTKANALSTKVALIAGEQRSVGESVNRLAADLPAAVDQVASLREKSELQQKDVAETQEAVQKLTREVAALRESVRRSRSDSERRFHEIRAQLDAHAHDGAARAGDSK
jgi:chromosome segregation ATPase